MYSDAENLERYRTARHEGIHVLAALAHGHTVLRVDVDAGESLIEFSNFPYEMVKLRQKDPTTAARVLTGVIIVCTAPAAYDREDVNAGDAAALAKWRPYWSGTPTWHTLSTNADSQMRLWLRQPQTQRQIRRLSEQFYIHRRLEGSFLDGVLDRVTQPPPAPPVAAPVRPTRAGAKQPTKTGLDIQYQWLLDDAETLRRSVTHAKDQRPHSPYRPSVPRFARLVA